MEPPCLGCRAGHFLRALAPQLPSREWSSGRAPPPICLSVGRTLRCMAGLIALLAIASPARAATPRIYNGRALAGVPPWMAFVVSRSGGDVAGCGGAAIAPNVVMTAAHCIVDEAHNTYIPPAQLAVAFRQGDPWGALFNGTLHVDRVVSYAAPPAFHRVATGGSVNDVA